MKVTIINHSDIVGGASVVSLRLLDALIGQGIDARMIVKRAKGPARSAITAIGGGASDKATFFGERLRIFMANGFSRARLFKVSTADRGLKVAGHPWVKDADIVVMSWFNQGMMSLDEVRRIGAMGKPIVWTMHDMWPMTGICHHAGDCSNFTTVCGHCPYLGSHGSAHDLSTKIFHHKQNLYDDVPIHFVAVSRWLASRAAESTLLGNRDVEVINNAFPIDSYPTTPGRTRAELGLPDDGSRLAVMCAARLDDTIKDLPSAIDALNLYDGAEPLTAVFCGDIRNREVLDALRIPYVWLGNVSDAARLADIYAHASVVMSSSTFETLPTTLIEGMAAGAVPMGFGGDGRDEIIDHLATGYLARRGDTADFASGIRWALESGISREELHRAAAARWDAAAIARRYVELFNRLLSDR